MAPPPSWTSYDSDSTINPLPQRSSAKALKLLGATEEEVRVERAVFMSTVPMDVPASRRVLIEVEREETEDSTPTSKPSKVLGLPTEPPLEWLQRRASLDDSQAFKRRLPSKALAKLGATIDDVRIEKALLVLGEAPGREVPAGKLPRPKSAFDEEVSPQWATSPPVASGYSIFLCAFLPWGILAPLNVLKLQLNKVSPGAHLWVPLETEQCQAACGVARMWATLFWSMQFANAVACVYLHYHRERGLALLGTAHKMVVGATLLKAYVGGVIYWPIGLVGACVEFAFAFGFARELRRQ